MKADSLPKRPIVVFMNAPAIPGQSTFCSLQNASGKNYWFYCGYNHEDEMTSKRDIPVPVKPYKRGSTTLGCDWAWKCVPEGEVRATEVIFDSLNLHDHFIPERSGVQRDHDILSYFEQMGFNKMLVEFFNDPHAK